MSPICQHAGFSAVALPQETDAGPSDQTHIVLCLIVYCLREFPELSAVLLGCPRTHQQRDVLSETWVRTPQRQNVSPDAPRHTAAFWDIRPPGRTAERLCAGRRSGCQRSPSPSDKRLIQRKASSCSAVNTIYIWLHATVRCSARSCKYKEAQQQQRVAAHTLRRLTSSAHDEADVVLRTVWYSRLIPSSYLLAVLSLTFACCC